MKSNKHLLILSPGFAASVEDDRCIPTLQALLEALQAQYEVEITVVAFQYPFRSGSYHWKDIPVYPLNGQNRGFPFKLVTWKKAYDTIRKIHTKQPITTIHSFWMSECALIGNRVAKKYNLPHFVTLMGQDALAQNRYLKLFANSNVHIAALSEQQANEFGKNSTLNVHKVIPFGLQPTDFDSMNEVEKDIDIIGVGALSELKNFSAFINVVAKLAKTKASIRSVIIGDGEKKTELEQQIEHLGLTKQVTLYGALPRKETLRQMQRSKVLLHLSRYESQAYVFSEALMSGCFVVSNAVGIAEPSSRWQLVNTESEAVNAIEHALKQPTPEPLLLQHINETAQHYYNWYDETAG